MQITGIILAGGKSSRMGADKALLETDGETFLKRAINLCLPFCSEILISSNHSEHGRFGHKVIPDEIEDCGPLGGIYSCLKHSETAWNFVLSVDSPFVEPELLRGLISETNGFDAVVPVHDHGKEPLIALYHKDCLPKVFQQLQSGNYKMHSLLEKLHVNFVDSQHWVEKYPKIFHNLNRPEDMFLLG